MHQSIPSPNIPGVLHLLGYRDVYHLNCPGIAWESDLLSDILSTKLSVDATLRHFFSFKLIYQVFQVSSEKICSITGGIL